MKRIAQARLFAFFCGQSNGAKRQGVGSVTDPIRTRTGIGTSTLLTLPQTGTENSDHNPDRVQPAISSRRGGNRQPVQDRA